VAIFVDKKEPPIDETAGYVDSTGSVVEGLPLTPVEDLDDVEL
jgi:hypothetical protein